MSKELILLYFRSKSTVKEDKIVEDWLNSSPVNTQQALRWIDELTDEEEKLFLKLALSGDDVWKRTISEVGQMSGERPKRFQMGNNSAWYTLTYKPSYRYAAILFSVLMLAFTFYLYRMHSVVDVRTNLQKPESIILPDGSNVILNANSRLKYAYSWQKKPREVWLEGEGFFNIKDKPDQSDFVVYLSGKKILAHSGSVFNVSERNFNSAVFLKSGRIIMLQTSKVHNKQCSLKPGEYVELKGNFTPNIVPQKASDPEKYYSWTNLR